MCALVVLGAPRPRFPTNSTIPPELDFNAHANVHAEFSMAPMSKHRRLSTCACVCVCRAWALGVLVRQPHEWRRKSKSGMKPQSTSLAEPMPAAGRVKGDPFHILCSFGSINVHISGCVHRSIILCWEAAAFQLLFVCSRPTLFALLV